MPSALKFMFGADATPFVTAMKVLEASATKAGTVTIAQMKNAARTIEESAIAAQAAGKSTVFYSYAVEGLNQKIAAETARLNEATAATNRLAEARTKSAMADFAAGKHGPLTGSEVIGKGNNSLIEERMRLMALSRARAASLTGSEVIGGPTGQTARLAALRAEMTSGSKIRMDAARKEIQDLVRLRQTSGLMVGGRTSLQGGSGAMVAPMFISVLRDASASLASGQNPMTVILQQAPQVAQALTMVRGGIMGMVRSFLMMKIGVLGTVGGVLAGVAAGAVVAYLHVKKLMEVMTSTAAPDVTRDYLAKHLRGGSAIIEMWRTINKTVAEATEKYNSAAAATERIAAATKTAQDHQSKLLDIAKETALAKARTPGQKEAVEKEFAEKKRQQNAAHRQEEIVNQREAQKRFANEAREKAVAASKILGAGGKTLTGETKDDEDIRIAKDRAAKSEEAAEKVRQSRMTDSTGTSEEDYFVRRNRFTASDTSEADIRKGNDAKIAAAKKDKEGVEAAVELKRTNDLKREEARRLGDQSAAAKVAADAAGKKAGELTAQSVTAGQSEKEIDAAEAERRRIAGIFSGSVGRGGIPLTSQQQHGAYIGGPAISILDLNKSMDRKLGILVEQGNRNGGNRRRGVNFGGGSK